MAHHHGQYKTSGLESVLKDVFGHDLIFGADIGGHNGIIPGLKVGVTATSSSRHAFLLTNYNRSPPEQKSPTSTPAAGEGEEQDDDIDIDDSSSMREGETNGTYDAEGNGGDEQFVGDEQQDLEIRNLNLDQSEYHEEPSEKSPKDANKENTKQPKEELRGEGSTGSSEESLNEPTDTRTHHLVHMS